jgi:hypothetical protein
MNSKSLPIRFTLGNRKKGGGGAHGSVVVKTLCYKPEGRGFDTR